MPRIDKIKFLLFLLISFHIAVNFMILRTDKSPLLGDQFNNFLKSGHIHSLIIQGPNFPEVSTPKYFGLIDAVYPPLMYFTACLFYLFGSLSIFMATFSVTLFFAVLIFFSFKCYSLFMSKADALFLSAVLSFVPGIYGFSRVFHVDFVLAALVPGACYYIFLSMEENKKLYWFLAGIFTGLCFLSKQSAVIFLLPTGIYVLLQRKKNNIRYSSLLLYCVSCTAVSSFWYIINLSTDNSLPFWAICGNFGKLSMLSFFKSYVGQMRTYLCGNPVFLSGILGIVYVLLFVKEKSKRLFASTFLFSLLFFSGISGIYSVRYLVPSVFFLCFFIPIFLKMVFKKKTFYLGAKIIFLSFLIFSFFQNNISVKNFEAKDLILKDDKSGLLSAFLWEYDISPLTKILNDSEDKNLKVATLFNTIDTDYLRYALWNDTKGKVLLKKEGMVDVFHGKEFGSFIKEYNVLLLPEKTDLFLLQQQEFPKEFIDAAREKIERFKSEPDGFSFVESVKVSLGKKTHTYLVFISAN